MNEKQETRRAVLARRDAIPSEQREERSLALCRHLVGAFLPALPAGATVAVFSALKSEVDLSAFCSAAQQRGFRIAYPCMVKADGTQPAGTAQMQFFLLDPALPTPDFLAHPARAYAGDGEALEGCTYVEPEEIDAVLVPLVAFDDRNNRLGYGGGNYDRLLSQMRPNAVVAGIAFAEQRVEQVPLEPHDLPLPHIFVA